jgi:hypothetical protein
MKFCENYPDSFLKQYLSQKDLHGNTGLSYLECQGYHYTPEHQDADFFISICGKVLPRFVLQRTILVMTEPATRYPRRYSQPYKQLFGAFLGISKFPDHTEDEFYLVPQEFSSIQPLNEQPDHTLVMVHQRYKTEYRDLEGDSEREKAVAFFDQKLGDDFHTYGRVWRQTLPWPNSGWKGTIKGSIMGDEKLITVSRYKFVLCFENSREDGYISEKLFSGFLAGAIPIYFGARDISRYIPKECYIEFDGQDYEELYRRIREMTAAEYQQMRTNARDFIFSEMGQQFTSIALARKLEINFDRLKSVPKNHLSPPEIWKKTRFLFLKYAKQY